MEVLFINGKKNGYDMKQCGKTLTVGELIAALQEYEEDMPVYLNHNGGYTYGSIIENDIYESEPKYNHDGIVNRNDGKVISYRMHIS